MLRRLADGIHWYWSFYFRPTFLGQRQRWTVVQGIVLENDRVLLIKRTTPRVWELPGGGIEDEEEPATAVGREVWEETGVEVRVERKLGVYQRLGFRPHDGIAFVCTPIAGRPRNASDETIEVRFFPVDRLPLGLLPWYREVIRDALDVPAPPRTRRQWLGPTAVFASVAIVLGEHLHLIE